VTGKSVNGAHVVVQVQVDEGWAIIDPTGGLVYDAETYFATNKVKPTGMLTI